MGGSVPTSLRTPDQQRSGAFLFLVFQLPLEYKTSCYEYRKKAEV
jgi:hypothetical protein